MNKHLMLTAAALLGATTTANAGTHSFQFGTAGGGTYCDGGTVHTSGIIWTWQHSNNNCAGGVSIGMGLLGKVNGLGKGALMSDNYSFGPSITISTWLPKRLKNGSVWSLWIEFSGVSGFLGNSGVLVNVTPGRKNVALGHAGTRSTSAKVKTVIQSHLSARQKI